MKKFSKLKFLQSVGLLDAKFNYEKLCFERSRLICFKSKLIFFANLTKLLELFVSPMFEREDLVQLYIGSFYNSYTGTARFFMGWVVSILISVISVIFIKSGSFFPKLIRNSDLKPNFSGSDCSTLGGPHCMWCSII